MRRSRFKLALALIAVAICVTLLITWSRLNGQWHPVKRGPIVEAVYGLGTVTAIHTFNLKLGITSTVTRIHVKEGDLVKANAPLLMVDGSLTFRAPWEGTITSLPVKEGETASPNVAILTMMDLRTPYLLVSLEQQGALRVKREQQALLSFESLRTEKFHGVVRSIYPSDGQFLVRIDVDNLPPEILPGMTADVAIQIDRKEDALLVPIAAINNGKVVVRHKGGPKKIDVTIGNVDGEWAEIISGDLDERSQVAVRKP